MCHICLCLLFFFFNDTATTEIYTLSLHDALPISAIPKARCAAVDRHDLQGAPRPLRRRRAPQTADLHLQRGHRVRELQRSEEHTSELQSRQYLVCRLLLEKKKKKYTLTHALKDSS